ncbi:uncharacterized protein UTRI_06473 [Ustilago trichophora]|uniref:Transmembrane protein 19 n=1 Tax=Ustilago trichophora TaxID=86804 RepID=A0A5C3EIV9_9BASI|nr:uncharacterized protein UTRI_06473 [Ustilago trichophora]
MSEIYPISLVIAGYLGYSGYGKGSLSLDGAMTASAVGYATMANPFVGYGLTLITFYLTGSKATKFKASVKAQLETHATIEPLDSTPDEKKGVKKRDTTSGNRNAIQVLCNSATAVVACIAFRVLNRGRADVDPMGKVVLKVIAGVRVSNLMLTLIVGGHYAACMGDTLASELGILSKSQPRLITSPWKIVPKGTNGGISPLGLIVSALGGTLIGVIQTLCLLIHYQSINQSQLNSSEKHAKLIALLTASGLFGSLMDSLLGATLQQTLYNNKSKKVLVGTVIDVIDGKNKQDVNAQWVKVTGWNVLDNNAVNFIASAMTAVATAWIGLKLF